jgi:hypothetical protein
MMVTPLKLHNSSPRDFAPDSSEQVLICRAHEILDDAVEALHGRRESHGQVGVQVDIQAGKVHTVRHLHNITEQAKV